MKKVLILCTGNSARSQMAEGLLRHIAGDRFEVRSAGTKPSSVRPEAIAVMKEIGIDISSQRSKHVDDFAGEAFDYVLTVCDNARESCPIYPGHGNRLHHSFEDPAALEGSEDERLTAFRRVRDQIKDYLWEFPARRIEQPGMRIEILYFEGCPNHPTALGQVREAVRQEGAIAEIVEVEVKDAATALALRFLGSPTIRVNGLDVEVSARSVRAYGLTCRTYAVGSSRTGVPPIEWIRAAVREARSSGGGGG